MGFRRANVLLALVAVALGALLYAEVALLPKDWLTGAGPAQEQGDESPAPPVLARADVALPAESLPSLRALDETTGRPLFVPGRRPPSVATPVVAPTVAPVAAPPQPPPEIELTAIVIAGDSSRAYALDPQAPGLRVLREGQTVEGWQVAAILPDGIRLERGARGPKVDIDLRKPLDAPPPPAARRAEPGVSEEAAAGNSATAERVRQAREEARRRAELDDEALAELEEEELREIEELEAAIEREEREQARREQRAAREAARGDAGRRSRRQ